MGGDGWAFSDKDPSGKTWTKADRKGAPLVQSSDGYSIDFFTDNFNVKHLVVVDSAQKFNTLLANAKSRQTTRAKGNLVGNDGYGVSPSTVNTSLVVTLGMLAAWGGDIIKQFKAIANKPTGKFKGINQWTISSELKGALCMTHKSKGAGTAGVGAYVSVTLEKSGNLLYVTHLHAAAADGNRALALKNNSMSANNDDDVKRQTRFNKQFAETDYSGLDRLFG